MKLELDENVFWLSLWSVFCFTVAGILITLMWTNHLNEKQFIEGGFTRESLPGQSMCHWVKK